MCASMSAVIMQPLRITRSSTPASQEMTEPWGTCRAQRSNCTSVGSVAMTKYQRLYETAIFKTLGATSRTIIVMLVVEYGTLGLVAGVVGSAGALGLTWGLTRFLLEINWSPAPWINVGGLIMTALVVGVVGVASSLDVLRKKPLGTLRAE